MTNEEDEIPTHNSSRQSKVESRKFKSSRLKRTDSSIAIAQSERHFFFNLSVLCLPERGCSQTRKIDNKKSSLEFKI